MSEPLHVLDLRPGETVAEMAYRVAVMDEPKPGHLEWIVDGEPTTDSQPPHHPTQ